MKLSVSEYAARRGISRQAVLKQISKKRPLPKVTKVEKVGETYILHTTYKIKTK